MLVRAFFIKAGEIVAQYAIDFNGSGIATLQKDIASAEDAMNGLSKQAQGLADSVAELFSSIAPDKLMGQVEKTVKRVTTTVRKETKKALLAFDEIERLGEESSKTTTTSVTTTTTDTANVDNLTNAFTLLQGAIASALGAVESTTVVEELAAIRTAAEGLFGLFSGQTFVKAWLGDMGAVTGGIDGVIAALGVLAAFPAAGPVSLIALAIQGVIGALSSLTGGWSTASSTISGLMSALSGTVQNVVNTISAAFSFLSGDVETVFTNIGGFLAGVFSGIGSNLQSSFSAIGTFLQENFPGIGTFLGEFFTNLGKTLKEKCDSIGVSIQEAFAGAGEFLSTLFFTLQTLAKEAFGGISTFVKEVFSTDWSESFGVLGGILNGFLANTKNVAAAAKGVFSGLVDYVNNALAGNWSAAWKSLVSAFKSIWNGIKAVAKSPINAVIGFINGLISGVISGINSLITALNAVSFNIPTWVPVLGGKSFGFTLSTLKTPSIPYLAQGAVLPANKPFMAVVGDQKNGTNVEAPLDTIKQALLEVMQQQGDREIVLNFTGDLAQLGRVLRPVISAENRRVGASLVRRGAL